MYDAYKTTGEDQPRFRLTQLKRAKPSIRDILLTAVDTTAAFPAKEKTKADSVPGDTWYTK